MTCCINCKCEKLCYRSTQVLW